MADEPALTTRKLCGYHTGQTAEVYAAWRSMRYREGEVKNELRLLDEEVGRCGACR